MNFNCSECKQSIKLEGKCKKCNRICEICDRPHRNTKINRCKNHQNYCLIHKSLHLCNRCGTNKNFLCLNSDAIPNKCDKCRSMKSCRRCDKDFNTDDKNILLCKTCRRHKKCEYCNKDFIGRGDKNKCSECMIEPNHSCEECKAPCLKKMSKCTDCNLKSKCKYCDKIFRDKLGHKACPECKINPYHSCSECKEQCLKNMIKCKKCITFNIICTYCHKIFQDKLGNDTCPECKIDPYHSCSECKVQCYKRKEKCDICIKKIDCLCINCNKSFLSNTIEKICIDCNL